MKRAAGILVMLAVYVPASAPTWEVANSYAVEYAKWANLRNVRVSAETTYDTISVPEFMQWQRVKSAWRVLEKQQDAEYRGER